MATKKKPKSSTTKTGGRAKPLGHTPGLTKTRRRYEAGGKLKTS